MRHFVDPERDGKVENRAKKVVILKVARYIVPKIVQIKLKVSIKKYVGAFRFVEQKVRPFVKKVRPFVKILCRQIASKIKCLADQK